MKRILKLAVYGIVAISLLASCRNGETRNAQSWPEWFETATPFDKDFVDVLFFAGTNIESEYDKDGNELLNITLTDAQKAKIADEYKTAWTLMCPDSVSFFAPYYHQGTFAAITDKETAPKALGVSSEDASAAAAALVSASLQNQNK